MSDKFQKILDEAYAELGNPIVLFDTSYFLLAHTENPVTDDPIWNELVALNTFNPETVDFFNRSNFIQVVAASDTVALLKTDELKYDRATGKIYDKNGIQVACITVVACLKPFEQSDFSKIAAVCERISAESEGELNAQVWPDASWLSDLLEARHCATPTPELPGGNLFIAVVDTGTYEHTDSHLAYFRSYLERQGFRSYIYLGNVVLLLNSDAPTLIINRDLRELNRYFIKYNIFAGISGCFRDLSELRKHYRRALTALNHGITHPSNSRIFKYESLGIDEFLSVAGEYFDLMDFCNPTVLQLRAHDKAHGTNYLNLLYIHLLTGQSYRRTSKFFRMPQAQLRERLTAISKKFGIRWSNGSQLASLLMSMKIIARLSN